MLIGLIVCGLITYVVLSFVWIGICHWCLFVLFSVCVFGFGIWRFDLIVVIFRF